MNKEKVIIEAQRIPSHFNYDWLKCKARDVLWIWTFYMFVISLEGFYIHFLNIKAR